MFNVFRNLTSLVGKKPAKKPGKKPQIAKPAFKPELKKEEKRKIAKSQDQLRKKELELIKLLEDINAREKEIER